MRAASDAEPLEQHGKPGAVAGSDGGGLAWAAIATLLTTAKINKIDPYAWLKLTLERIATGWPNRNLEELMPWNYQALN